MDAGKKSMLRCIRCNGYGVIEEKESINDDKEIVTDALRCRDCGETYDSIWGVPFFGLYEEEELYGLIEIAANCDNCSKPSGLDSKAFAEWERVLEAYHLSCNRGAYLEALEGKENFFLFLANRYNEWMEIRVLMQGMDIQGSQVLDVGAGLGFDGYRLVRAGAMSHPLNTVLC
jgi:hypothetical protein